MSDSLEFKSRKELKELCNNFGIRTAGVKHEDLVRLLRTKVRPKNEVHRSASLRGNRNGSMKDSLPRMENRNSGGKTPKKSINIGQTLGNVLHDANGLSAAERRMKEGLKKDVSRPISSSARLLSHADFLADENGQDAFSSADIDSLSSFAEPSECSIDDVPDPFETPEFGNSTSSKAQKFEDRLDDAAKKFVARDTSAASDLSLEISELSIFSIPDWVSMSVDDPPLLDWERNESVPTGHVFRGDEFREVPTPECMGSPNCGDMGMTEEDAPEIRSTLEHNMGNLTLTGDGEGRDVTNLATSSPAAKNAKFQKFPEEEYVTSEMPTSGLSLLPTEESVSPMVVEARGHFPADSLDCLCKELQEDHKDTQLVVGTSDECVLKDNGASQAWLETEANQEQKGGGTDTDMEPSADAPAKAFSLPTNSPKGFVESYEEPETLDSEWAAESLPMSIPEHTVSNDMTGHTGVEREEYTPKVGFLLSLILWCACLCWRSKN
ncbi:unnamed protein product [Sphagnum troendelagicum]|uniref:SAP domain-containing protein n=1 Tax=Sphagnum troendelagicum TaxID=128251 RepID=A0ABP0TTL0_9BRYO